MYLGWLVHLVSRIACNTKVIVKKARIKSLRKHTKNVTPSLNQMAIRLGGKSHRVAVWWIQTVRLKICDSHLTCKVANKCLNVREWVEKVEWNKRRFPPSPCCPVSHQCPSKKTMIEKKKCSVSILQLCSHYKEIHTWS